MIDPLYYCSETVVEGVVVGIYCSETVVEGVVVGIRAGSQSQKLA